MALGTPSPTERKHIEHTSVVHNASDTNIGALHLDARLPNMDYYKHFKRMVDDLADLGETFIDRTLILNMLRGLNQKFPPFVEAVYSPPSWMCTKT